MGKLTVVVGLPGAGKTTLIQELQSLPHPPDGICVSDFMKEAHKHSRCITDSKHYGDLVRELREGKGCLIGDIAFCDTRFRKELEVVVNSDVQWMRIDWIFFENDANRCRENVKHRGRTELDKELAEIDRLSRKYFIPMDRQARPVWNGRDQTSDQATPDEP